jgi:AraC-like DNA-binding protein
MMDNFDRALELPERLETDYLRILYYDFPKKYTHVYNAYEYARLCTILEGEKTVSVNHASKVNYDKNKFLLIPQDSFVDMTIIRSTKALVFELNDALVKKISENISLDYNIDYNTLIADKFLVSQLGPQLNITLSKIVDTLNTNQRDSKYFLDVLAQELIYYLVKIKGTHQILTCENDNPINLAIKCMEKEYMNRITVKMIADELGMSDANFSQYFKKVMGINPKEYLIQLKMKKAKEIIEQESVTDAAFDLGYENISYFIKIFKEKYGMTPKQYKKRII